MAGVTAERPRFFEGQYLGADDLAAIVEYVRVTTARQNIGQHSWGVVTGLDIASSPISDTAVEYFVQPGVAVDGYGRIIVVNNPTLILAEDVVNSGADSGRVDVWICYDESNFEATRRGFLVCAEDDRFQRINESFKIVVGNKTSIQERQSGVTVNDILLTDARSAFSSGDPEAEILCDASVPHQLLPIDDASVKWMVPLGLVIWSKETNSFRPLVDPAEVEAFEAGASPKTTDQIYADLIASRSRKRMIGVVAENILAADGLIRLRQRTVPLDPGPEIDPVCAATNVQMRDLIFCDKKLKPKELVWLEGDARVTGDMRLFDGRLEFKDEAGGDYIERQVAGQTLMPIEPLLLQRKARNPLNIDAGADLQVLLGDKGDEVPTEIVQFRNRLAIGSIGVSGKDLCAPAEKIQGKVFVQDNGRVGIGTYDPETKLHSPLTIRGLETQLEVAEGEDPVSVLSLVNFEGQGGALEWQINLGADKASLSFDEGTPENSRLFLQAGGNVGIGTNTPGSKLDVSQVSASSGGSALGSDIWFRVGNGPADGRVWIEHGDQDAPLMVLSDQSGPPRLRFQQTGADTEDSEKAPAHFSWFGHSGNDSPDLAIVGGSVAIGTQNSHIHQLMVQSNGGLMGLYSGRAVGHTWVGFYNDGSSGSARSGWLGYQNDGSPHFKIRNEKGGGHILLDPSANVGIDTDTPTEKLEVRGNIKLGSAGDVFAVGCVENVRIVSGRVSFGGAALDSSPDYDVVKVPAVNGTYFISFTPGFTGTPTVVATLAAHTDNVVSVHNVSSLVCTIQIKDVEGLAGGDFQNAAFNFVAIGAR